MVNFQDETVYSTLYRETSTADTYREMRLEKLVRKNSISSMDSVGMETEISRLRDMKAKLEPDKLQHDIRELTSMLTVCSCEVNLSKRRSGNGSFFEFSKYRS